MSQPDPITPVPRVCVAVVIDRDNRVLLLRRRDDLERWPGTWCFPGGMLEFGESLVQCCRREVAEETGIRCGTLMSAGRPTECRSESDHLIGLVYWAIRWDQEPANREPEKHDRLGWFAWDDLPSPLMPGAKQFIDWYLELRSVIP